MQGYEWPEQRSAEEIGFVRAIRTVLTSHLSTLRPALHRTIVSELDHVLSQCETINGQDTAVSTCVGFGLKSS